MKSYVVLAAVGASVVAAQAVDPCISTITLGSPYTITALTASTYCGVCDAARATGGVYTTVYATTLVAVCPTGLTSSVYTVTNVATGTTPINAATVPPGYVATAIACTGCPGQPTVTVTIPAAAAATAGAGAAVGTGSGTGSGAGAGTKGPVQYTGGACTISASFIAASLVGFVSAALAVSL